MRADQAWGTRRTADLLRHVSVALSKEYGDPRLHNKSNPLDELIFIILSAKTVESSYLRTYKALRRAFPAWSGILKATPGTVAREIEVGGLAAKKESQIRSLLEAIRRRTGKVSLSFLFEATDHQAEAFLTSLPGVGLKTARCVLMYSLGRTVFPVDTHVRRVLSRLGAIEFERLTDGVQDSIQAEVPKIRYLLHVNLVAHGRAICRARDPLCDRCVLSDVCLYYSERKGDSPTARNRRSEAPTPGRLSSPEAPSPQP